MCRRPPRLPRTRTLFPHTTLFRLTGNPAAGIAHALAAIDAGRHIVMVNVEADALAGPLLAARARAAGVVYSLAYGDQPALVCEMVDWARAAGFEVVAAGKGTKYLPAYHRSEEHTSELQSLMRLSYAVFCLKNKNITTNITTMTVST